MSIFELVAFVFLGLGLLIFLRKYASHLALFAEFVVIVIVFISVSGELKGLINAFSNITEMTVVSDDILKTMLKAFSILTVGGISSDICRDNGENAVAGVLDTVVKILACATAMPTFTAVLVTALSLLEQ